MSTIAAAIGTLLTASSGLTALVGDRIYYRTGEQDMTEPGSTYRPNLIYSISIRLMNTQDGPVAVEGILDATAYALNPDDSDAVLDALRSAINSYSGTSAGLSIKHILETDRRPEDADRPGVYGMRASYDLLFATN